MIRAVCFDFDGTLAHFTGDFELFTDSLRAELMLVQCDLANFAEALSRALRREGQLTLYNAVRKALEELEQHPPDVLKRLVKQALSAYASQTALLPGALDVLLFCQQQALPCALLTNGPADMQRAAIQAVGVEGYFRRILASGDADVAARKPNARIFKLACEALGTEPGETLMVGDNLEADIKGALPYGMRAVYLGSEPGTGYETVPDIEAFGRWLKPRL